MKLRHLLFLPLCVLILCRCSENNTLPCGEVTGPISFNLPGGEFSSLEINASYQGVEPSVCITYLGDSLPERVLVKAPFGGRGEFRKTAYMLPPKIAGYSGIRVDIDVPHGSSVKLKRVRLKNTPISSSECKDILIHAHLGYGFLTPMNTAAAFEYAGRSGFKACVCNPIETVDGKILCYHEGHVSLRKDLCDELFSLTSGEFASKTADELLSYHVYGKQDDNEFWRGTRMATFEEFASICAKYGMAPTLSQHPDLSEKGWVEIKAILDRYGLSDKLTVKSFGPSDTTGAYANLEKVHALFGDSATYIGDCDEMSMDLLDTMDGLNLGKARRGIEVMAESITEDWARKILDRGYFLSVFNVKDDGFRLRDFVRMGATEFTSDNVILPEDWLFEPDNGSALAVISAGSFEYPLWRGERAGVVVSLQSREPVDELSLNVSGAPGSADFIFDVKGDVLTEQFNQCDDRPAGQFDSIVVADRIGPEKTIRMAKGARSSIWLGLDIPQGYKPGRHKAVLKVKAKGFSSLKLPFTFEVSENSLPEPHEWSFHLDLWQNPYSVARYFNVPLWSEEHFAKMKPVMQRLASAGQKVVTTTILNRPWDGQTEDAFGSMVTKIREVDGRWTYDYSIFDKWVQFMFDLGIDRQINCYSMIPWAMSFDYVDALSGKTEVLRTAAGSPEYRDYWCSFIKDFSAHLKEKGWFEKTAIAMDEREEEDMKAALSVIREAEPEMRVALVGTFHPSIADDLYDYCLGMKHVFPEGMIERRRQQGRKSTWYVCCSSKYPNTYIASNPMEATWMGWYTAAAGLDGMLRWAYNSWTADPVHDARFRTWPAGDCYMIYPESSSVRFQRLLEGIQDFEKIRILRQRWESEGRKDRLESLDGALATFRCDTLGAEGPQRAVSLGRSVISGFYK